MSQPSKGGFSAGLSALVLLLAFGAIVFIAGIPLDIKTQVVFSSAIFLLCLVVGQFKGDTAKSFLIVLTLLISVRYMWWRWTSTLAFEDPWSAFAGYTLFAAEIYAFLVLCLGYFQTMRPLKRQPVALPVDTSHWPTVDVLIPTYNEPLDVVAATVSGAMNLEWPENKLRIYLLDDGNRTEFRDFANAAGIHYRARTDNKGAKAGNLNEALRHCTGELVAIFDCDQIPVRSFLQMTVGWFLKDARLAQLQTPQYFYSPDPIEKNLALGQRVPNESSLFYGLIQDGNDLWNAAYFCGSCAVLRRSAIESIGGIAEETVTEDAHTSIKLHRKGYNSAYINVVQSAGLATESLAAHINQRIRWARGLAQVFRIDNPLLGRGLSLGQRLCYTNATVHFLYAAPRLIFLLAPICFLVFDLSIIQSEAIMVAAMALPHIIQNNLTAARLSGRWRHVFWAEVYETVLSFYIFMPTLVALLMPSRGKFNVTQKGHSNNADYYAYRLARPFILIGLLNAVAIAIGGQDLLSSDTSVRHTTILNVLWASYNLVIVGVALAIARESKQTRRSLRHVVSLPAVLTLRTGRRLAATIENLSVNGARARLVDDSHSVRSILANDDIVGASFDCGEGMMAFPAHAVLSDTNDLRIAFDKLSISRVRGLVRILYSPADRWRISRESIDDAGAIKSLVRILAIGIKGWYRLVTGVFTRSERSGPLTSIAMASLLAIALSLGVDPQAHAQTGDDMMVYDLRHITDKTDREIELGSVKYGLSIPFNIRRDTVVNSGELDLLLSWQDHGDIDRRLAVAVNGRTLWQASASRGVEQHVVIPFSGVQLSDYNTLSFGLAYDNTEHCSSEAADSFTLTIHDDSRIAMNVSSIPIANELDTLPLPFFDERDPRRTVLHFVLPESASEATLLAAGRVAAWFGVLASYRGVEFRVSLGEIPEHNAIVIADRDALPASLQWLDAGVPRVMLVDSPSAADRQLLVLTAPLDDGLSLAVDALLQSTGGLLPEGYQGSISKTGVQTLATANRWLDISRPTTFTELAESGNRPLSIVDNDFSPLDFAFQVPGDFHRGDERPYRIDLDYHYGPNFPDFQETMAIALNGVDLKTIDLAKATRQSLVERLSGAEDVAENFHGTTSIDIPNRLIQSHNRLEVRFTAPASVLGNCNEASATRVDAGISGSSTLDLTRGILRARYPDLSLFVNSGMPFTRFPDLKDTHIELPITPTSAHYAIFLSLMSRFADITGNEPSAVSIGDASTSTSRTHRIIISDLLHVERVNAALRGAPILASRQGLQAKFNDPATIYHALADWSNPISLTRTFATASRRFDPAIDGIVVSKQSTERSSGVDLILLATTDDAATRLQVALTDPIQLGRVHGNVLFTGTDHNLSINTGRTVSVGTVRPITYVKWWLGENFIITLLLVVLLSTLVAVVLPRALSHVADRRLH